MRLSHYLLIIATIGWMAVALVWGVNRFVVDISFAPLEFIYLGALLVSALIGGLVFQQVGALAAQAEFGDLRVPRPWTMIENMRQSRREKREKRTHAAEVRKARKTARELNINLRRW